jgi:hypothetical protein
MEYLLDEGQHRARLLLDPTRGLIYSQGTLLQHFIFAIVALVIQFKLEPPHLGEEGDVIWEWDHAA